jgi:DnaJ-class molecular chaperone
MAPVPVPHDHYAVLETAHTVTVQVIRQAYKKLALLRHPDKQLNNPKATEAFQLVSPELLKERRFLQQRSVVSKRSVVLR